MKSFWVDLLVKATLPLGTRWVGEVVAEDAPFPPVARGAAFREGGEFVAHEARAEESRRLVGKRIVHEETFHGLVAAEELEEEPFDPSDPPS